MKIGTSILAIAILAITLLGGFSRFYKIDQNPPGLNVDEVSFGYSAYSVLQTGRDEYGKVLPLVFKSLGDFKNPIPTYLMVASIKLFGLNDFAVRFPNALMGTLTIPIFFFFLKSIFKSKKVAILGSFMLAISTWHIFYSRFAYETVTASLFILLGVWFFIKMFDDRLVWVFLSAFFFTLTMYTAFAPRLFIPVFILCAGVANYKRLKSNWRKVVIFAISCFILGIPLIYTTLFQGAGTRLQMVFISNDIEFSRYVLLKAFDSVSDLPLLLFLWAKRYLSHLNPSLLFFNSLEATSSSPIGLGMLYVFEIPLLIAGIVALLKNKIPYRSILVIWILTGLIPDSLTNNLKHTGRLLHLFPVLLILSTYGAIELYNSYKRIGSALVKVVIASGFVATFFVAVIRAFLVISVHFPRDKGESFNEGWREVVQYVIQNQNKYQEIVFDPARGIDAPNMISNPLLYVLFYTRYNPHVYQTEQKVTNMPGYDYFYKFGKYTFRHIDWQRDKLKIGVLFIGSPWSMQEKNLKPDELIKKIYISSGDAAFFIVSPK